MFYDGISLLCTNESRCGLGPVVGSDLALAPGRGLLATGCQGRESILWGEDITLQLVFCKQWTFIHVKRQENNWQTWRIVLYCFSLFVVNRGQLGLLSHTTTIVRIWCGQNSRVVEVSTWPIFISMHRVHSKCQCQQSHSLFNNNGEHTLYTI